MLTSFLSPFVIHPVVETIYESGRNFPLRGTANQREIEEIREKYRLINNIAQAESRVHNIVVHQVKEEWMF